MKSDLPRELFKALSEIFRDDVPWEVKPGSKHCKVVVAGRMIGVAPDSKSREEGRHLKNLLAQAKRAAASFREKKVLTSA